MVGKKVMVLVNLKPAKLAGVLSEGMLLCAEDAEGNLALMTPEKAMPSGAEICKYIGEQKSERKNTKGIQAKYSICGGVCDGAHLASGH